MTTQELIEQAIATGTAPPELRGLPDYQHVYYGANGQPYYKTVGGGTQYIPPAAAMSMWDEPKARAWAARPENGGFAIDAATPEELQQKTQGTVDASGVYHEAAPVTHGKAPETGFWQTDPTWNSQTGQYESGFNWEHLLDLAVGGGLGAGAASAIAGAGAGAGASSAAAGSVPEGVGAGTGLGAGYGSVGGVGGVGLGEVGATTGLASGAGLPGAVGLGEGLDAALAIPAATAGGAGAAGAAGGAGAASAYGPYASGYGLATTEAQVPAALASVGGGAGGGAMSAINSALQSPLGSLATNTLGGFLSGLGQSLSQQKRQSFAGTAADPAKVMGDLGTGLKGLIGNFQTRSDAGVSLPDAFVDTRSPTFTGGGMAMPVGQLPDFGAAVASPVSLQNGIIRRDSTALPSPQTGGHTQADRDRALAALNLLGVS